MSVLWGLFKNRFPFSLHQFVPRKAVRLIELSGLDHVRFREIPQYFEFSCETTKYRAFFHKKNITLIFELLNVQHTFFNFFFLYFLLNIFTLMKINFYTREISSRIL